MPDIRSPIAINRLVGYGLVPRDEIIRVVNRSAATSTGDTNPTSETITAGEVVLFTLLSAGNRIGPTNGDAAGTPSPYPGTTLSVLACVSHKWAASENAAGLWGVAVEDIGPTEIGRVQIRGRVKCNVWHSTNGTIAPGNRLVANALNGGYLDALGLPATATGVRRFLGWTLEGMSGTTSTGGQIMIAFDGINGFGGANG